MQTINTLSLYWTSFVVWVAIICALGGLWYCVWFMPHVDRQILHFFKRHEVYTGVYVGKINLTFPMHGKIMKDQELATTESLKYLE